MTYYRIRLQGRLYTLSDLHIGGGETDPLDKANPDEPSLAANAVLLDSTDQPYIPASTLRGFLRSQLPAAQADILFGSANQQTGVGMIGLVRIYDARWQSYPQDLNARSDLPVMTRTRIDPVTQAAKQHHLFSHRVVPVQTCFQLYLEIDQRLTALRASAAEANSNLGELDEVLIQVLLNALANFNEHSIAQLGKGKSIGQGRLAWTLDSLEAIPLEKLKVWAQSKQKQPLTSLYISIRERFALSAHTQGAWQLVSFQLKSLSPLLINNPEDEELKSEETGAPKQVFLKRLGEQEIAAIPASSLKGWCRAHSRRILLTLTQHTQSEQVESLLAELFGSTEQVGCLRFYDATVKYDKTDDIHTQTFNAVDRFTGGVKDGALYTVQALYPQSAFHGQFAYQGELPPWAKWLLLLVWRDAEQGDLVLGYSKSKGYGQLKLQALKQGSQAYFELHQAALKQGAEQLQQKLAANTTGVVV